MDIFRSKPVAFLLLETKDTSLDKHTSILQNP
jgi:hypothetical protein